MSKKDILLKEIDDMPEILFEELIDFIRFLKLKCIKETYNTTIVSEPSLKKDWLKPEEDEAWKNL